MAGVKISELPPVALALTTDFFPVVEGGVTSQETLAQVQTLFGFSGGILSMAHGGTNAALVAANGAIPYSTASAIALLAAGSSGQLFQSGGVGAPNWTTATYPSTASTAGKVIISDGTNFLSSTSIFPNTVGAVGKILRSDGTVNAYSTSTFADTYAINTLLYNASANTVSGLATANSATLITSASGVPSLSQTLPSPVQTNIIALGTQSQALNMGTHLINNVVDPASAQDAATKNYVDQVALNGASVYAATTATLNATQSGAGIGATLTDASGTFAAFSIDGVSPPLNSSILNKDQTAAANQGIYTLTRNGDGISIPWQLTRATDYDTANKINNTGLIIIRNGTQVGQTWYNTSTIVTVDTTAFSYSRFGNQRVLTLFNYFLASTQTNVTGDGTVVALGALTKVTDRNNDVNAATGIFTAPATGDYVFIPNIFLADLDASNTNINITIVTTGTSAGTYYPVQARGIGSTAWSGGVAFSATYMIHMTAGDTAQVKVQVSGSTKTINITAGSAAIPTCWQGYVVP